MQIFLLVLSSYVLGATLLPFRRTGKWWIRAFDFLRLQTICIGLATLGGLVGTYDGQVLNLVLIGLVGSCVAYYAYRLYPYTLLSPHQVLPATTNDPTRHFCVLMSNIQMDNQQVAPLLTLITDVKPDILFLLEPNAWWTEQLRSLDHAYPYAVKQPQDNFYGMLVYSRLPLAQTAVKFLVEDHIPSIYAQATLDSGDVIDLYCLHPEPPVPSIDTEERDAELLIVGKQVRQAGRPCVVGGDLNDVAGSPINRLFQNISGLLDPRIGRGLYNTHPTYVPFFRAPVDHVFHSDEFRLVALHRLPKIGSDHFPICIKLSYEPEKEEEQEEPTPTPQEKARAEEIIENGE
jgi:endonuclease/exonuclease/phosphatase (EEP) superfamily protein YafD